MKQVLLLENMITRNLFGVVVDNGTHAKAIDGSGNDGWADWVNTSSVKSSDVLERLDPEIRVRELPLSRGTALYLKMKMSPEQTETLERLILEAQSHKDVSPDDNRIKIAYLADVPLQQIRTDIKTLSVTYKALSFQTQQRDSALMSYGNYVIEEKGIKPDWDPNLGPGGGWRCPAGTINGGQVTDKFGRGCGRGIIRRIGRMLGEIGDTNIISGTGEALESVGERMDRRRAGRAHLREVGRNATADYIQNRMTATRREARRAGRAVRRTRQSELFAAGEPGVKPLTQRAQRQMTGATPQRSGIAGRSGEAFEEIFGRMMYGKDWRKWKKRAQKKRGKKRAKRRRQKLAVQQQRQQRSKTPKQAGIVQRFFDRAGEKYEDFIERILTGKKPPRKRKGKGTTTVVPQPSKPKTPTAKKKTAAKKVKTKPKKPKKQKKVVFDPANLSTSEKNGIFAAAGGQLKDVEAFWRKRLGIADDDPIPHSAIDKYIADREAAGKAASYIGMLKAARNDLYALEKWQDAVANGDDDAAWKALNDVGPTRSQKIYNAGTGVSTPPPAVPKPKPTPPTPTPTPTPTPPTPTPTPPTPTPTPTPPTPTPTPPTPAAPNDIYFSADYPDGIQLPAPGIIPPNIGKKISVNGKSVEITPALYPFVGLAELDLVDLLKKVKLGFGKFANSVLTQNDDDIQQILSLAALDFDQAADLLYVKAKDLGVYLVNPKIDKQMFQDQVMDIAFLQSLTPEQLEDLAPMYQAMWLHELYKNIADDWTTLDPSDPNDKDKIKFILKNMPDDILENAVGIFNGGDKDPDNDDDTIIPDPDSPEVVEAVVEEALNTPETPTIDLDETIKPEEVTADNIIHADKEDFVDGVYDGQSWTIETVGEAVKKAMEINAASDPTDAASLYIHVDTGDDHVKIMTASGLAAKLDGETTVPAGTVLVVNSDGDYKGSISSYGLQALYLGLNTTAKMPSHKEPAKKIKTTQKGGAGEGVLEALMWDVHATAVADKKRLFVVSYRTANGSTVFTSGTWEEVSAVIAANSQKQSKGQYAGKHVVRIHAVATPDGSGNLYTTRGAGIGLALGDAPSKTDSGLEVTSMGDLVAGWLTSNTHLSHAENTAPHPDLFNPSYGYLGQIESSSLVDHASKIDATKFNLDFDKGMSQFDMRKQVSGGVSPTNVYPLGEDPEDVDIITPNTISQLVTLGSGSAVLKDKFGNYFIVDGDRKGVLADYNTLGEVILELSGSTLNAKGHVAGSVSNLDEIYSSILDKLKNENIGGFEKPEAFALVLADPSLDVDTSPNYSKVAAISQNLKANPQRTILWNTEADAINNQYPNPGSSDVEKIQEDLIEAEIALLNHLANKKVTPSDEWWDEAARLSGRYMALKEARQKAMLSDAQLVAAQIFKDNPNLETQDFDIPGSIPESVGAPWGEGSEMWKGVVSELQAEYVAEGQYDSFKEQTTRALLTAALLAMAQNGYDLHDETAPETIKQHLPSYLQEALQSWFSFNPDFAEILNIKGLDLDDDQAGGLVLGAMFRKDISAGELGPAEWVQDTVKRVLASQETPIVNTVQPPKKTKTLAPGESIGGTEFMTTHTFAGTIQMLGELSMSADKPALVWLSEENGMNIVNVGYYDEFVEAEAAGNVSSVIAGVTPNGSIYIADTSNSSQNPTGKWKSKFGKYGTGGFKDPVGAKWVFDSDDFMENWGALDDLIDEGLYLDLNNFDEFKVVQQEPDVDLTPSGPVIDVDAIEIGPQGSYPTKSQVVEDYESFDVSGNIAAIPLYGLGELLPGNRAETETFILFGGPSEGVMTPVTYEEADAPLEYLHQLAVDVSGKYGDVASGGQYILGPRGVLHRTRAAKTFQQEILQRIDQMIEADPAMKALFMSQLKAFDTQLKTPFDDPYLSTYNSLSGRILYTLALREQMDQPNDAAAVLSVIQQYEPDLLKALLIIAKENQRSSVRPERVRSLEQYLLSYNPDNPYAVSGLLGGDSAEGVVYSDLTPIRPDYTDTAKLFSVEDWSAESIDDLEDAISRDIEILYDAESSFAIHYASSRFDEFGNAKSWNYAAGDAAIPNPGVMVTDSVMGDINSSAARFFETWLTIAALAKRRGEHQKARMIRRKLREAFVGPEWSSNRRVFGQTIPQGQVGAMLHPSTRQMLAENLWTPWDTAPDLSNFLPSKNPDQQLSLGSGYNQHIVGTIQPNGDAIGVWVPVGDSEVEDYIPFIAGGGDLSLVPNEMLKAVIFANTGPGKRFQKVEDGTVEAGYNDFSGTLPNLPENRTTAFFDTMNPRSDGKGFKKIVIKTPSRNDSEHLRETIGQLLAQRAGFPSVGYRLASPVYTTPDKKGVTRVQRAIVMEHALTPLDGDGWDASIEQWGEIDPSEVDPASYGRLIGFNRVANYYDRTAANLRVVMGPDGKYHLLPIDHGNALYPHKHGIATEQSNGFLTDHGVGLNWPAIVKNNMTPEQRAVAAVEVRRAIKRFQGTDMEELSTAVKSAIPGLTDEEVAKVDEIVDEFAKRRDGLNLDASFNDLLNYWGITPSQVDEAEAQMGGAASFDPNIPNATTPDSALVKLSTLPIKNVGTSMRWGKAGIRDRSVVIGAAEIRNAPGVDSPRQAAYAHFRLEGDALEAVELLDESDGWTTLTETKVHLPSYVVGGTEGIDRVLDFNNISSHPTGQTPYGNNPSAINKYKVLDDGTIVIVHTKPWEPSDGSQGKSGGRQNSYHGLVTVIMPSQHTDANLPEKTLQVDDIGERLTKAAAAVGVEEAGPISPEDFRILGMKSLLELVGGPAGSDFTAQDVKAALESNDYDLLKAEAAKLGVSVFDIEVAVDSDGSPYVRLTKQARDKMASEIKHRVAYHNVHSTDGTSIEDRLVDTFKSGFISGAVRRNMGGIPAQGSSTNGDADYGSGQLSYWYPGQSEAIGSKLATEDGFIITGTSGMTIYTPFGFVLERLTSRLTSGDNWGHAEKHKKFDNANMTSNAQVLIDGAYSIARSMTVVSSQQQKTTIINRLNAAGVTEIDGIPLDILIAVQGSPAINQYATLMTYWKAKGWI